MANTVLTLAMAKDIVKSNELVSKKLMEVMDERDFVSLARNHTEALATKPAKTVRYTMADMVLDALIQLDSPAIDKEELFSRLVESNNLTSDQWESFRSACSNIKSKKNSAGNTHPSQDKFWSRDGKIGLYTDVSASFFNLIHELGQVNDEDKMEEIISLLQSR